MAGEEISYKMSGMKGPGWDWKLGDGGCATAADVVAFNHYWQLALDPGATFGSKGKQIRTLIPLPASNTDFGETNGTILVTANGVHDCNNKARVFYDKEATTNPGNTNPNWIYYWQDNPIIQDLLNISPGLHLFGNEVDCQYDSNPTDFDITIHYGSVGNLVCVPMSGQVPPMTNANNGGSLFQVTQQHLVQAGSCSNLPGNTISGYDPANTRLHLCDAASLNKPWECGFLPTESEGIHSFYRTVAHETQHVRNKVEVWNYTHPSDPSIKAGWNAAWDMDNDGFKDLWETTSSDGMLYGFVFNSTNPLLGNDRYSPNYSSLPGCDVCVKPVPGAGNISGCSAGTWWEENKARQAETTLTLNDVDKYDWSYSSSSASTTTKKNQGKQW